MNKVLMTAVANLAAFLASAEGPLDEDATTQQLEELSADLRRLSDEEREELARHIDFMATEARGKAYHDALNELPTGLGLRD